MDEVIVLLCNDKTDDIFRVPNLIELINSNNRDLYLETIALDGNYIDIFSDKLSNSNIIIIIIKGKKYCYTYDWSSSSTRLIFENKQLRVKTTLHNIREYDCDIAYLISMMI